MSRTDKDRDWQNPRSCWCWYCIGNKKSEWKCKRGTSKKESLKEQLKELD